MSVQEVRLKAIADAIREKDGTTQPIPAKEFPDRIRAIPSGDGGGSGGACGIVILDDWQTERAHYTPRFRLADFSQAAVCSLNAEILEGY